MKADAGTTLPQRVRATIARHALLRGVRRLGIAVSGGSDSTALLRLLLPLCRGAGVQPVVLHLDHGLRGAASAADARAVARLARRLGVGCRVAGGGWGAGGFSVPHSALRAPRSARSLEMRAREARLAFFRAAAEAERLDAIATGHTSDDVAETLLLRLARGSGAAGLAGLRPRHVVAGVAFVRPLLEASHAELRAWLRRRGWTWREDATNRDTRIPRNRVRRVVLPWLEKRWVPSLRERLRQSAAILRDEDALLEEMAKEASVQCSVFSVRGRGFRVQGSGQTDCRPPACEIRLNRLNALAPALQRRVIRTWLMDAGFDCAAGFEAVERLRAAAANGGPWPVCFSGGARVSSRAGRLRLTFGRFHTLQRVKARPGEEVAVLPVPGTVIVAGARVTARRGRGIVRTAGPVGSLPSACSLDAAALAGRTVHVRTRRPGDRIRPLGLDGSKSLQDLFVDAKVPAACRDRLPLLVVDGEVAWVPGYRIARAFAVRGPRAASVGVGMQKQ